MPIQANKKSSEISRKQVLLGSLICMVGAFFYCYEFVLRIIPGALQSELSAAFGHISATTFGQLSALYYFAYSPMQLPVGMLMDKFGPRRLLVLACFCCTLGSWMFCHTSSLAIVGMGRFLVGFGSSFAFVGVLSLAVRWLPPNYLSLVAGLMTTLAMLGLVYGEMRITTIAASHGWYYVLFSMVIIGAVLNAIILLLIRDAPQKSPSHYTDISDFFSKALRVLTLPQVWLIGIVGACLYTSLSVFGELWGKEYLEAVHHLTKIEAAKAISMVFLGWAVGAPITGFLSDLTGKRILPLALGGLGGLICISIILYSSNLSRLELDILLFLYGLFCSTEIIVFVMAKENSNATLAGTVFAVINMIITLGGVIFQPLVGKLLDFFSVAAQSGEHVYTMHDYQYALSILPISLLLVVVVLFFMQDRPSS